MAQNVGPIFQAKPAAGVDTLLFTATATTVFNVIKSCNQSTPTTTRLRVAIAAAASADTQWLQYDLALPANEGFKEENVSLRAGDELWGSSASGNVSISGFGTQSGTQT